MGMRKNREKKLDHKQTAGNFCIMGSEMEKGGEKYWGSQHWHVGLTLAAAFATAAALESAAPAAAAAASSMMGSTFTAAAR